MRIEKKYTFDLNNYNNLLDQILISKYLFKKKYNKRIINSIYFDNELMQNYSDNLSGISKRSKIMCVFCSTRDSNFDHSDPTARRGGLPNNVRGVLLHLTS